MKKRWEATRLNVLGLILCNLHDGALPQLTATRTAGAVPFGGRYRMIDFPLSALVHAGAARVDVIAHRNYGSLIAHIGSGKEWDMARHEGGIRILPPYSACDLSGKEQYRNRTETLRSARVYLENAGEETVICCECEGAFATDLSALAAAHRASGAALTLCADHGMLFAADRGALCSLIERAEADGSFEEQLQKGRSDGTVNVYAPDERFFAVRSFAEYYTLHMMLAHDRAVFAQIFGVRERPILTKEMDSVPTRYGAAAHVSGSLIADGCVIEGRVIGSVVARGVHVERGCEVRDAVLLDACRLRAGARVSCGVVGKNAVLGEKTTLCGHPAMPFFVEEGRVLC